MDPIARGRSRKHVVAKPKFSEHLFNAGSYRKHRCKMCPSGFDSETEVEIHRVISHRAKLIRGFNEGSGCTVCQTPFLEEEIQEHLEKKHLFINNNYSKIQRPVYVCDECHMLFFNPKCLIAHINFKHLMVDSMKIKCPVCEKPCRWRSIIQHMDNSHTRSLKFCPICLEKQEKINFISTHVNMEHPVKHKCKFCKHKASNAKELDHHLLEAHRKKTTTGPIYTIRTALRYFTRLREGRVRLSKMQFPDRGINIQDMAALCILCQTVVYSSEEMGEHLAEHAHNMLPPLPANRTTFHAMASQSEPKKTVRVCECGATFTNEVLYKHHVFKMHTLPAAIADNSDIMVEDSESGHLSSQESDYTSGQAMIVGDSDEEVEIQVVMADGHVEVLPDSAAAIEDAANTTLPEGIEVEEEEVAS